MEGATDTLKFKVTVCRLLRLRDSANKRKKKGKVMLWEHCTLCTALQEIFVTIEGKKNSNVFILICSPRHGMCHHVSCLWSVHCLCCVNSEEYSWAWEFMWPPLFEKTFWTSWDVLAVKIMKVTWRKKIKYCMEKKNSLVLLRWN